MKVRDIIAQLDKSPANEQYVGMEDFDQMYQLYGYSDAENTRLKSFWICNHYCTDTYVGMLAYFLDDVFIGTSYQSGRKSDLKFELQAETLPALKRYVMSRHESDDIGPTATTESLDEDVGLGYSVAYGSQLLDKVVILRSTGEEVPIVKVWHSVEDIKLWRYIRVLIDGEETTLQMDDVLAPFKLTK